MSSVARDFGPFRLLRRVAVGGMAEIHLARTRVNSGYDKYVALKMIHPNFAEDEQFVNMLIDEARIAIELKHPNIARVFDLGHVGDTYYITMEYVDGADLYKVLRSSSEKDIYLPFDCIAAIAKGMTAGLDYAHTKVGSDGRPMGIVHRDVSPQNVLVSYSGEVKLVDFGIAKAALKEQQTAAGIIKGKYYYMSPEQAWGEVVDTRSDIFSAGIVLYEMITGQMLYLEEHLHKLLDMVRKADIAPPNTLRPDCPPELARIVMKALRKQPGDRYQRAGEMARDLERFLQTLAPPFAPSRLVTVLRQTVGDPVDLATPAPSREDARSATYPVDPGQFTLEVDDIADENSVLFTLDHLPKLAKDNQTKQLSAVAPSAAKPTRGLGPRQVVKPTAQVPISSPGPQAPVVAKPAMAIPSIRSGAATSPPPARNKAASTREMPTAGVAKPGPGPSAVSKPAAKPRRLDEETRDIEQSDFGGANDATMVGSSLTDGPDESTQIADASFLNTPDDGDSKDEFMETIDRPSNNKVSPAAAAVPSLRNAAAASKASPTMPPSPSLPSLRQAPSAPAAPITSVPSLANSSNPLASGRPSRGSATAAPARQASAQTVPPPRQVASAGAPARSSPPGSRTKPPPQEQEFGDADELPTVALDRASADGIAAQRNASASRQDRKSGQQAPLTAPPSRAAGLPLAPANAPTMMAPPLASVPMSPGGGLPGASQQSPQLGPPPSASHLPASNMPGRGVSAAGMPAVSTPPASMAHSPLSSPPHAAHNYGGPGGHAASSGGRSASPGAPGHWGQPAGPSGYNSADAMNPRGISGASGSPGPGAPMGYGLPSAPANQPAPYGVDEFAAQYGLEPRQPRKAVLVGIVIAALVVAAVATFVLVRSTSGKKAAVGAVRVESVPSGASVFVDDQKLPNVTPMSIDNVPVGSKHKLRIELKRYKPYSTEFSMNKQGQALPVTAILTEITGKLNISTTPPGADVYIRGSLRCRTPCTLPDLDMSTAVDLELRLKDYASVRKSLAWDEAGELTTSVELVKQ